MRYALVINGCSPDADLRAREMYAFALKHLGSIDNAVGILFYGDSPSSVPLPTVFTVCLTRYRPEVVVDTLAGLAGELEADLYIFDSTDRGNELAARFAARTGGAALAGVEALRVEPDGRLTCERPVYSGYLRGSFEVTGRPACITPARGGSADGTFLPPEDQVVRDIDAGEPEDDFIEESTFTPATEEAGTLETADFILAVGNGASTRQEAEEAREAAEALDAEFGASRPLVMNGWVPMNRQLGASGVTASPKLCLALGISGSAAFMAGVEKSGFIAAVNIDARAPIMKQADAVVVGDYRPVLQELARLAAAEKE